MSYRDHDATLRARIGLDWSSLPVLLVVAVLWFVWAKYPVAMANAGVVLLTVGFVVLAFIQPERPTPPRKPAPSVTIEPPVPPTE